MKFVLDYEKPSHRSGVIAAAANTTQRTKTGCENMTWNNWPHSQTNYIDVCWEIILCLDQADCFCGWLEETEEWKVISLLFVFVNQL